MRGGGILDCLREAHRISLKISEAVLISPIYLFWCPLFAEAVVERYTLAHAARSDSVYASL